MSPPAQKARSPAPRRITALTAGSSAHAEMTISQRQDHAGVSAFSAFGRLSVMRPIPPATLEQDLPRS